MVTVECWDLSWSSATDRESCRAPMHLSLTASIEVRMRTSSRDWVRAESLSDIFDLVLIRSYWRACMQRRRVVY